MPDPNNPMGRQIMGGAITPVYVAGFDTDSMTTALRTVPNIHNLTILANNTEYQFALPYICRRVTVYSRGGNELRLSFAPGVVGPPNAPYLTIPANAIYDTGEVVLTGYSIYVVGVINDVVEIEYWW